MPPLVGELASAVATALDLSRAGELARVHIPSSSTPKFDVSRLEYIYELAFLRMFVAWEIFLEESFHRYLCGYSSSVFGQQPTISGVYHKSLSLAEAAVLAGAAYKLWHDPQRVEARSRQFFVVGSRHEVVMASSRTRIAHMASVRHRVAHGQDDAALKFDAATQYWVGHRYKGSRPGRFLRDHDTSSVPPRRWIETLGTELVALAGQIT
jgi:hypothetical protein